VASEWHFLGPLVMERQHEVLPGYLRRG
jgi:hypothetical protein